MFLQMSVSKILAHRLKIKEFPNKIKEFPNKIKDMTDKDMTIKK